MTIKVADDDAVSRLMRQIDYRCANMSGPGPIDPPTRLQVAAVLHALADHTAILEMLKHRPDPRSPWPEATSIGRWFHDVGDELEYKL